MIYASDFRKGKTFTKEGEPCVVVDFQHVKPGKGAAFVRTKYKNLKTGAIREEAFNPNDKFEPAVIETREMQFLYSDGDLYYFMDNETYEQMPLTKEVVQDAIPYMKENDNASVKFYHGLAFQLDAPTFVELKVVVTEPGIKGDTASNVTKAATVETGAVVHVPLFVNEGDTIRIDTRSGEYMSRV
ncbi:MAG: elongation factor P [Bacillota bacterium]|nr:elongation factor P [Bacillota bacterium]MDW7678116.1 elongation factor P [Bacillota bacterium]